MSKKRLQAEPPAAAVPRELLGLARVQAARVRPKGDATLKMVMDRQLREIATLRRAVGACARAFEETIPAMVAKDCRLEDVQRGVLTVSVPNAGVRFALDRVLRSGGEKAFIRACSAQVRSVRVVVKTLQERSP